MMLFSDANNTEKRLLRHTLGEALHEGVNEKCIPKEGIVRSHDEVMAYKYVGEGGQRPTDEEIFRANKYRRC
jgi:hypothetical protein